MSIKIRDRKSRQAVAEPGGKPTTKALNLRIPLPLYEAINERRAAELSRITLTRWIFDAIEEKLRR
jgi:predicted HicB family RNase H-like nuclease